MPLPVALVLLLAGAASEGAQEPGVVSHVKVVSDKVQDVSSLEAWRGSFIHEGMTDAEKAMAVWRSVASFQLNDEPPRELLQKDDLVHDPIKLFNVYGYSFCSPAASSVMALARHAGLTARGRNVTHHVVPEIRWGGSWHMLDASLVAYFPAADGSPAGVDEVVAGVSKWLARNPGLAGDPERLRLFARGGGWRRGPDVLARCPTYDENGWLPAGTHGWFSNVQEYDGTTVKVYEPGYSMGYQVNVQLRRGERLVRRWSNRGLHVNLRDGSPPTSLDGRAGEGILRHTPRWDDLGPGRIGNGTLEYDVPLAGGSFRDAALAAENLAGTGAGGAPGVRVADPARPGVLVLRMPSSYVYLGGRLELDAAVGDRGSIAVFFSDNHGLDWREIARIGADGDAQVDLTPHVFRRYDYRLKMVLAGSGTGLDRILITHDIQHSQRALPALGEGTNTITFSAGPDEGTVTIEGSTNDANLGRQLHFTDFRPDLTGIGEPHVLLAGRRGDITFPVATPGDIVRLRFGCHYRTWQRGDRWDLEVSFDGGRSFRRAGRAGDPTPSGALWVSVQDVPRGVREALVRFSGRRRGVTLIFGFRIDADYREPRGGFRPVKITYEWEEGGRPKRHVHVARSPRETYTIVCDARPLMKSIALELAD